MQNSEIPFKRNSIKISIYIILFFFIQLISRNPIFVEKFYATSIYIYIGRTFRFLIGWIPFSVGDIIYLICILWLVISIFRFLRNLFRRKYQWKNVLSILGKGLRIVMCVYIIFYLFWGLNYFRKGIAYQLGLERKNYSTEELKSLASELALKASFYRKNIEKTKVSADLPTIQIKAVEAYQYVALTYPFLHYKPKSIKKSLFGAMGNYLGYTGYYNPFTGEAQLNTHTPAILLPAIYCHEMAHQLGYATEDEANFVGYLSASHSKDTRFLYSIYLDLYQYAASELYVRDSSQYFQVKSSLDTLVKKDIHDIRDFYRPYQTKINKVIGVLYGQYLKANNQPQGIDTYSDVISLLIAYRKKYQIL